MPWTDSLGATEKRRVCETVLQLLADGVITPYAGQWRGTDASTHCPCCCCALPKPALPRPPNHRPSSSTAPPAGQRFPLEQAAQAMKQSQALARGGKVLLEG